MLILTTKIIKIINTTSTRPTARIKAVDETEGEAIVYTEAEAVKEYTGRTKRTNIIKEINIIEKTRRRDSSKKNTTSIKSRDTSLLSTRLKNKKKYIRISVNIFYIYRNKKLP
jgi:hypothetical protein